MGWKLIGLVGLSLVAWSGRALTLGPFVFDDTKFGDTLLESDGGAWSAVHWLNVFNMDPGNPAYLTGAHVRTGIANIGHGGPVTYRIGYNTGIVNQSGDDLGVIVARDSSDPVRIAVSLDGTNYTSFMVLPASQAVGTGVQMAWYYGASGGNPFDAELFVHPVNLDSFGVGAGQMIRGVAIEGYTGLDLIRVAGLVPEPSTLLALASFALLAARRRGNRKTP